MRSISVISLISTDTVCSMCYGWRGRATSSPGLFPQGGKSPGDEVGGREEGATPLYKPSRYVPPQRVTKGFCAVLV